MDVFIENMFIPWHLPLQCVLKLCMVAHAHLFDFIFPSPEKFFSNVTLAMELWNHRVLDWNHITCHMEGSYGCNGTVMVDQYDKIFGYGCWMTSVPTTFHIFLLPCALTIHNFVFHYGISDGILRKTNKYPNAINSKYANHNSV